MATNRTRVEEKVNLAAELGLKAGQKAHNMLAYLNQDIFLKSLLAFGAFVGFITLFWAGLKHGKNAKV